MKMSLKKGKIPMKMVLKIGKIPKKASHGRGAVACGRRMRD